MVGETVRFDSERRFGVEQFIRLRFVVVWIGFIALAIWIFTGIRHDTGPILFFLLAATLVFGTFGAYTVRYWTSSDHVEVALSGLTFHHVRRTSFVPWSNVESVRLKQLSGPPPRLRLSGKHEGEYAEVTIKERPNSLEIILRGKTIGAGNPFGRTFQIDVTEAKRFVELVQLYLDAVEGLGPPTPRNEPG